MIAAFFTAFAICYSANAGVSAQTPVPANPPVMAAEPWPPSSLLLFTADWCAPCLAEIRRLPVIEQAARPYPVLLVSLDRRGSRYEVVRRKVREQNFAPSFDRAWSMLFSTAMSPAAVPISVMTDAAGQPCAIIRRELTADGVAALRRQCRAP